MFFTELNWFISGVSTNIIIVKSVATASLGDSQASAGSSCSTADSRALVLLLLLCLDVPAC